MLLTVVAGSPLLAQNDEILVNDDAVGGCEHSVPGIAFLPGGRFIISPSSDHSHWPELGADILENYRVFVDTALRHAAY